jgi:UDP-N-acetylmuramate dehydrogenase
MKIASPFSGLESIVQENYPLKRHTWYRVGGPARYFVRPTGVDDLREAMRRCNDNGIPIYVLGLGANLLVRDEGVDGAVFRLNADAFTDTRIEGDLLHVGAGVDLQKLIVHCVREGLGGIETLAGIPGTIGGAVKMNAGGKFGDLGAHVESVTTLDQTGEQTTHTRDELLFTYRSCNLDEPFILGATLKLTPEDPDAIVPRYKEVWMYKRNSQPLNTRNSGCIFKNPAGSEYSAGALIDRAGLKGMRVGRAEVSQKHANFIIADPDCPSSDVLSLIQLVQDRVRDLAGVRLEREVKIWPATS